MRYLIGFCVVLCMTHVVVDGGMFDGLFDQVKNVAQSFMGGGSKEGSGDSNPMMQGMQQLMQVVKNPEFMQKMTQKVQEMSQKIQQMSGGGGQMQEMFKQFKDKFEDMKKGGASQGAMHEMFKGMMDKMKQGKQGESERR